MAASSREPYTVELEAPDIDRWHESNTGIPYVHSFEAERPGPHALITAVVHGNEICGAIALDLLLREAIRPERGRMTLAFANVAAYERFDPEDPTASRYVDEDFNRVWSEARLDGPGQSVELARARELRGLVAEADLLLDLHSMQQSDVPLSLCGPLPKGRDLARRVGYPATIVADRGHAGGTRMRDYGTFSDPDGPRSALLVECGQHWTRGSDRVAIETALRFLATAGLIDLGLLARYGFDHAPDPQRLIEVTQAVTIESDDFTFEQDYRGLEIISEAGTVIAHDGERAVKTPYDDCILIMPSLRLQSGQTAVRLGRWVE